MAKSPRWTIDAIRAARANLDARVTTIINMSESQIKAELKAVLGFTPDTSVTVNALRRWLVGAAIEQYFPDSPPQPPRQEASPSTPT